MKFLDLKLQMCKKNEKYEVWTWLAYLSGLPWICHLHMGIWPFHRRLPVQVGIRDNTKSFHHSCFQFEDVRLPESARPQLCARLGLYTGGSALAQISTNKIEKPHFDHEYSYTVRFLVRVSVFLRVRAAQGRLVGQRLRTTYWASLRVRFFKVVRKQIISRHAHNLS